MRVGRLVHSLHIIVNEKRMMLLNFFPVEIPKKHFKIHERDFSLHYNALRSLSSMIVLKLFYKNARCRLHSFRFHAIENGFLNHKIDTILFQQIFYEKF